MTLLMVFLFSITSNNSVPLNSPVMLHPEFVNKTCEKLTASLFFTAIGEHKLAVKMFAYWVPCELTIEKIKC